MTEPRFDREHEIALINEAMKRLARRMNATFVLDPDKVQDYAVPHTPATRKPRVRSRGVVQDHPA